MFTHLHTIHLHHAEDCALLGYDPENKRLYIEEIYDGWLAQHIIDTDGNFIQTADEDHGDAPIIDPFTLPDTLIKPTPSIISESLTFAGARLHGTQEHDRIKDIVQPLSLSEKMQLAPRLDDVRPLHIIGIAENHIYSEALVQKPNLYLIVNRLRIAHVVRESQIDPAKIPYDYDVQTLHQLQLLNTRDEFPRYTAYYDMPNVSLVRPMDCLVVGELLFIADGGNHDTPSRIHIWTLEQTQALPPQGGL